ncbi:MAG: F0F1 ATP synthase subunit delta [Enterocloster clostridioformis]
MVREAVKLLKENPELPEVLNSPVVPLKSKHAVIEKVFREPEFSALMVRFLKRLVMRDASDRQRRLRRPVTPMPGRRQVLWMPSFTILTMLIAGPDYRNETVFCAGNIRKKM